MTFTDLENVRVFIGKNKLKEAIDLLKNSLNDELKEYKNEAIIYERKYNDLKRRSRIESISNDEVEIKESYLANSILETLNEIEDLLLKSESSNNKQENDSQLVEILLEGNLKEFNSQKREELLKSISAILSINSNQIRIKLVLEGSVKVFVEIPRNQVQFAIKSKETISKELDGKLFIQNISIVKNQNINTIIGIKESNNQIIKSFYKNSLSALIAKMTNAFEISDDTARDLFQDSFADLWKMIKTDKLIKEVNLESFIFQLMKRKYFKLKEKEARNESILHNYYQTKESPQSGLTSMIKLEENEKLFEIVQRTLAMLDAPCKELVQLRYMHTKSFKEIAESLNYSNHEQAKKELDNCRKKLRKAFEIINSQNDEV